MKEFHGYYLKVYGDKVEVYKHGQRIATEDDEEKAKSYIVKIETGKETE